MVPSVWRTVVVLGVADHEAVRVQDELAADGDVDGRLLLVTRDHPHLQVHSGAG